MKEVIEDFNHKDKRTYSTVITLWTFLPNVHESYSYWVLCLQTPSMSVYQCVYKRQKESKCVSFLHTCVLAFAMLESLKRLPADAAGKEPLLKIHAIKWEKPAKNSISASFEARGWKIDNLATLLQSHWDPVSVQKHEPWHRSGQGSRHRNTC